MALEYVPTLGRERLGGISGIEFLVIVDMEKVWNGEWRRGRLERVSDSTDGRGGRHGNWFENCQRRDIGMEGRLERGKASKVSPLTIRLTRGRTMFVGEICGS
jgi:hypothetical protein